MIERGFDINSYEYGATNHPLLKAARHGYMDMALYLLDQGANINVKDWKGNSALSLAVWEGKIEMAKFLVTKGIDVDARNEHNWNALMQAIHQGHQELVEILIEKGSDVNAVDEEQGATPLILAAHFCLERIAKLLLENGADKTMKNKKGETAADTARTRGCNIIEKLIEAF